jgi:hypothetical protein
MTPLNRTQATTALTITTAHHPGALTDLLIASIATPSALTATLAFAAAFAPTTATRTAARQTLDLLLRLVPWYTPRR